MLSRLLAFEPFRSLPTRLGASGTIQQERLHPQIRRFARNDRRECSVVRGMLRFLAGRMFPGRQRRSSHAVPPIGPGETVLPSRRPVVPSSCALCVVPCAFIEPLVHPPCAFRHFIALVHVVTGYVEFAEWAPIS
jgi:hypothetical protein